MPNLFATVYLTFAFIFALERNTFFIKDGATCRPSLACCGLKIVRSYFINSHFLNIWVGVPGEHIFEKPSCSGRLFFRLWSGRKCIGTTPPHFRIVDAWRTFPDTLWWWSFPDSLCNRHPFQTSLCITFRHLIKRQLVYLQWIFALVLGARADSYTVLWRLFIRNYNSVRKSGLWRCVK